MDEKCRKQMVGLKIPLGEAGLGRGLSCGGFAAGKLTFHIETLRGSFFWLRPLKKQADGSGSGLRSGPETMSLDLSLDVPCTASKFFAFSNLLEAGPSSPSCGLGHILSRFAERLARPTSELPPAWVEETTLLCKQIHLWGECLCAQSPSC